MPRRFVQDTIAGVMAAVAGLVQTASIAVGSVRFGPELVMNSIAATILGGVIFGKGSGGVLGPFVGVLCFSLLFVLMTLGDERAVRATYVAGEAVYDAARKGDPFRYPEIRHGMAP